jgi:hypothetical protein
MASSPHRAPPPARILHACLHRAEGRKVMRQELVLIVAGLLLAAAAAPVASSAPTNEGSDPR